jgi:two-component system, NarL family, invasion response regulator UvrY
MLRVLLADDHVLFRQGLRKLLELEGLNVVGEAASGSEAIQEARRSKPEIVLLDISMPGRGAVEVIQELKKVKGRIAVLLLTGHAEDHFAVRCLKSGADGYITKDQPSHLLVAAIKRVATGGRYISPLLAEQLATTLQHESGEAPHESLSDREFEVMKRIAGGATVGEIGETLNLSVKTISTYRSRILTKLDLRNNAEIMLYAIKRGLVDSSLE